MRLGYSSTASRCGNAEMQPKIPTVVPLALDRTTVEYQSLYRTEHTTRTEGRDKYSEPWVDAADTDVEDIRELALRAAL